jgi:hypothetical protein
MSPKEFMEKKWEFVKELSKRLETKQAEMDFQEASNTTMLIFIDSGNIGTPREVYELFNDGNLCTWRFRGLENRR